MWGWEVRWKGQKKGKTPHLISHSSSYFSFIILKKPHSEEKDNLEIETQFTYISFEVWEVAMQSHLEIVVGGPYLSIF